MNRFVRLIPWYFSLIYVFIIRLFYFIFYFYSFFFFFFFSFRIYYFSVLVSLLLFNLFESFSHQRKLMVFHWILSDSKTPQVSRTLLSILDDPNNTVVGMLLTRPLISKSSCPNTNPLLTVPSALIIIGITVTFMFHTFFSSLARSIYLSLFSLCFSFTLLSAGMAVHYSGEWLSSFFFFFFVVEYP